MVSDAEAVARTTTALALALLRELKREELKVSMRKILERAEEIDDALATALGDADDGRSRSLRERPAGVGKIAAPAPTR